MVQIYLGNKLLFYVSRNFYLICFYNYQLLVITFNSHTHIFMDHCVMLLLFVCVFVCLCARLFVL